MFILRIWWLTLLELFWSSLYEDFENASASWDLVWNFLFLGEFGDFDNAIYQIEDVKDYVFYPEQVRLSEIPSVEHDEYFILLLS